MSDLWPSLETILPGVSRPARYIDAEHNSRRVDFDAADISVALIYPDAYEVGMSNLGLAILYEILSRVPGLACDRAFAPWPDMEEAMRRRGLPLFGLASRRPLADFDVLGITLQYEMTYTNILTILDLAGVPLHSQDRSEADPLVIGGGPCTANPEPVAPFFDAILIGDGEDAILEIVGVVREAKSSGSKREELLLRLAAVEGCYVPSFYDVTYDRDGTVSSIDPNRPGTPALVERRVVADLSAVPIPSAPIVPFADVVHDRLALEIMRGCTRGCRFCQAGMVYRPIRERPSEQIIEAARRVISATGYEDLSLVSLSSSDYSAIATVVSTLCQAFRDTGVAVSLPSQRVDAFSVALARSISQLRKTGLTFAPEAGTQRLRDVINKQVTEEDFERTIREAFSSGWRRVKLYYMIGLPTETEDDINGIGRMLHRGARVARQAAAGGGQVFSVSVSSLVPKAQSPFQWAEQDSLERILAKQELVRKSVSRKVAKLSWHDARISMLEGVMARGDRRVAEAVQRAWRLGCRLDAWSEQFRFDLWVKALADCGLDVSFYARRRQDDELFPWEHISGGVSRKFLLREWHRAQAAETTGDCRFEECTGCAVCAGAIRNVTVGPEESGEMRTERPKAGKPSPAGTREVELYRLRLRYAKAGPLRFLSHLEVTRALERAIRRSGLPFGVTGGFSPKLRLSFGPSLPVGVSSSDEYFDVYLTERVVPEEAVGSLDATLPDGLRVLSAAYVDRSTRSITAAANVASYTVAIAAPALDVTNVVAAMEGLLKKGSLDVERKGRRETVDLREVVRSVDMPQNVVGDVIAHDLSLCLDRGVHLRPETLLVRSLEEAGVRQHGPAVVTRTALGVETPEGVMSLLED